MALFSNLFKGSGHDLNELARRLGIEAELLRSVKPKYREFNIRKRSGGTRRILAPEKTLRDLQRLILRRVLRRLRAHPCATGFEKGHSIVTNALPHVRQDLVLRTDIRNFFESTSEKRVQKYFRKIGWNREAAATLTRLCTHNGGLPQGAPTSPRLSNLVNFPLDVALHKAAEQKGLAYTRYADDITFSGDAGRREALMKLLGFARHIARRLGYTLHGKKKTRIRRRHQRQLVTGLVVNDAPRLPRETRRRLRAIEHQLSTRGSASLSEQQLAGWRSLQAMIKSQSGGGT